MKHEWRKHEKEIYIPKQKPDILTVPKMKYFTITGEGNPNEDIFAEKIGALYAMSYAVRMMPKKGIVPEGYFEYTVYPLEGVWDLIDYSITSEVIDKNNLKYKIMIRQPEFVDEDVVSKAIEIAKDKSPYIDEVVFEEHEEGLCVQILHVGSYDDEPRSFKLMDEYLAEQGYTRKCLTHKEIYLSDFRKVDADKLKTALRYSIEIN